ncbi:MULTISPECIES: tRNA glutamyl-Q(34) synthetase GluQRS [unclassified Herbaspirillum]|uniref:tRNA glutamyl-Q(34) synthetase GluQRS n=1 Tax=unclassified Herbaspirillum TaxID=2624150 RepID=UPI00162003FA
MSTSPQRPYVGRFAPSPSGPLHAGSLVAALASYLDARAHNGRWLLRIEDVDETRTIPGAADAIQTALLELGMQWDGPVLVQSKRTDHYRQAYRTLEKHVYPCGCSRKEIMDSRLGLAADGATIYPGTCRAGLAVGKQARALRLRVPDTGQSGEHQQFEDRWLGQQSQHLASEVGDFVLKRADGFWAYQLAVVVDDAQQGVTHVVRGADLLDSTARQMYLQDLLGYPAPAYLHLPLVRHSGGEKLSKQNGAQALDLSQPLAELQSAARFLELDLPSTPSLAKFWDQAQAAWLRKLARLPVRA